MGNKLEFQWDEDTQYWLDQAQRAEELAEILRSIAQTAGKQEISWQREKEVWCKLGGRNDRNNYSGSQK